MREYSLDLLNEAHLMNGHAMVCNKTKTKEKIEHTIHTAIAYFECNTVFVANIHIVKSR